MVKKFSIICMAMVVAASLVPEPARAYGDNEIRFHLGLFTPEGDSAYWQDKEVDFTGDAGDFQDAYGGVDYLMHLGRGSVMFSLSAYEAAETQEYLDFEDQDGFSIQHETRVDITSFTVSYQFYLAPPRARVVPYLGAGGGLYLWELNEEGDFIDFRTDPPEIFDGLFGDEGEAFGYFGLAGIKFQSGSWNAFVEGRWIQADDELGDDFEGFGDLDLSGLSAVVGFGVRF